ncbi:hypothetical protein SAICODRAFT_18410 [Saitoella complicata NRRL Y-17804]|uniref:Oxidoreductase-like domain-containing protein n=1 Tax=Saitoella complicata (strain BCRC 22490 / CBS 7301 / JCM 7358 / NBRC 10748 / NRRL Y-17804) TaxID=698492 RepID=A0A0E9NAX7_SAICN|nr:uncharacterized protein SAICODRAFT_18410 [Saitoella complicata NRRL Y-17804]ODQ53842.1 hypothetical protein SAICODRAFT_18410 [Saitoella complicata NRRL Y-17804]GAO46953.1 hypothetical protein G7K_1170-t1 [Saitoella complicata NRRL Y-17804]
MRPIPVFVSSWARRPFSSSSRLWADFYDLLLEQPRIGPRVFGGSTAAPEFAYIKPSAERDALDAKKRKEAMQRNAKTIQGVSIPNKPEEPDNCCQSGCIHCVWDLYREDLQEWQDARRRAVKALRSHDPPLPTPEFLLDADIGVEDDPLEKVSPGMRAFMMLEKRIREKNEGDVGLREGAKGVGQSTGSVVDEAVGLDNKFGGEG